MAFNALYVEIPSDTSPENTNPCNAGLLKVDSKFGSGLNCFNCNGSPNFAAKICNVSSPKSKGNKKQRNSNFKKESNFAIPNSSNSRNPWEENIVRQALHWDMETFTSVLNNLIEVNNNAVHKYVCNLCNIPGHDIKLCPQARPKNEHFTPYQGEKRSYGEYSCWKCHRTWKSKNSWTNCAQLCKTCRIPVYPYKQKALKNVVPVRAHDESLCQKCMRLGTNCTSIKSPPGARYPRE